MTESEPVFSIVLPCYNEAANLPGLLARYQEVWEDLPAELILVDNGSTDDTQAVLGSLLGRPELAFARVVKITRNRGYGHGIHTGLLAARGKFLGFSHADMQTDPDDLFRAYHHLIETPDPEQGLVKGERLPRDFAGELLTIGMTIVASTVLTSRLSDVNAQPKVFHRSHLDRLSDPPDGIPYDLYVLYRARQARLDLRTIDVDFGRRAHGESRWAATFRSRWRTILSMIGFIFRLRLRGF